MNKQARSSMRIALMVIVTAVTLFSMSAGASANTRVPGGDLPYYARIGVEDVIQDGQWAAIAFYRPPECVPAQFNLIEFFDIPGAFACQPPTTAGHEVWAGEPGIGTPKLVKLQGLGAVPVWFMRWPELQSAIADGVLTMGDLQSMPSLMKGTASTYHETLRPTLGVKMSTIEFNAMGNLDDGRAFILQVNEVGPGLQEFVDVVHITFK